MSKKKELLTDKPDSVFSRRSCRTFIIYLRAPSPIRSICLPSERREPHRSPPQSPKETKSGVSVYLTFQPTRFIRVPHYYGKPCALTARFHPYPDSVGTVIFCDPFCLSPFGEIPLVKWCGALRCPDFPHSLLPKTAMNW